MIILFPGEDTIPEVAAEPPITYVYQPHYCHFFYTDLGGDYERNLGSIAELIFNKHHDYTVLKLTWEGNIRKRICDDCCAKWWFTVDGSACTNPEDIYTSISSSSALNIFLPTTLTGVCFAAQRLPLQRGLRRINLVVGNCDNSRIADLATGFDSSSRIIVEEMPRGVYYHIALHEFELPH